MGKKPEERELRNRGAETLARVRKLDAAVHLTEAEREKLLVAFGQTEHAVDELLSLETED